jgi:REP element-mobilizing transposase RayT
VDFLKAKIKEIVYTFNADIKCDKDHFHMLFKATPLINIPQFVNAIKTITSREIQRNLPKEEMFRTENKGKEEDCKEYKL